ncbi:MFS transporter [Pelotomaculum propionicicum]|nr:MFS transporter [Pelotomaculum propionicicum]
MNSAGVANVLGVFFPPLVNEYGWNAKQVSGIASCVTFGTLVASLLFGSVFSKKNTRTVVLIFGIVMSAAFAGMYFPKNLIGLYVLAFIGGIGTVGVGFVSMPVLITKWFDSKRSTALSIGSIGSSLAGLALVPLFTYTLYPPLALGSGNSFLIWGAVIFATVLISFLVIRDKPENINLKAYGHNSGDPQPEIKGSAANRDIGFSSKDIFRMPEFYGVAVVVFILGLSLPGLLVQIVSHLLLVGYSKVVAASIVSLYCMCTIFGKLIMGITVDKIGIAKTSALTMAIWGLAIICLYFAGAHVIFIYLFGVLTGLGTPVASIAPPIWTSSMFGLKHYASNYSKIFFCFTIGLVVGPVMVGALKDMTGSFHFPILVVAVLVFASVPFLLMVLKSAGKKLAALTEVMADKK